MIHNSKLFIYSLALSEHYMYSMDLVSVGSAFEKRKNECNAFLTNEKACYIFIIY